MNSITSLSSCSARRLFPAPSFAGRGGHELKDLCIPLRNPGPMGFPRLRILRRFGASPCARPHAQMAIAQRAHPAVRDFSPAPETVLHLIVSFPGARLPNDTAERVADAVEFSRRVIPVSTRNAGQVLRMTGLGVRTCCIWKLHSHCSSLTAELPDGAISFTHITPLPIKESLYIENLI
jgi:hypothetical protein